VFHHETRVKHLNTPNLRRRNAGPQNGSEPTKPHNELDRAATRHTVIKSKYFDKVIQHKPMTAKQANCTRRSAGLLARRPFGWQADY
jgi:hypothetical protein